MPDNNLPLILTLWMLVLIVVAVVRSRRQTSGVGLVKAYLFNLWLIHWSASLVYVLPWFHGISERFTTLGVQQSLYGVFGFALGSLAFAPWILDMNFLPRVRGQRPPDRRLPVAYLTLGSIAFVLLPSAIGRLPTMRAIISTAQQLVVVGLALSCWQALRDRRYLHLVWWIAATFCLPFITTVTGGFLGFGALAAFTVLIFLSGFVRSPTKLVAAGLILGYIGLSTYITYRRDREDLRASISAGDSLSDRIARVAQTLSSFEWFDPFNQQHLDRIDDRLNQSYLVGVAVDRLSENGEFAHGDTLWTALLALIPRAMWPDKPIQVGDAKLVTRFTGIQYDSNTSVGIGQVLEFYANFGTSGVFVGFALLGAVLTILDIMSAERLAAGDLHGFVLWFLPGMSFLMVGGALIEVTSSAAAGIIVALLANRYLSARQRREEAAQAATQRLSRPLQGPAPNAIDHAIS